MGLQRRAAVRFFMSLCGRVIVDLISIREPQTIRTRASCGQAGVQGVHTDCFVQGGLQWLQLLDQESAVDGIEQRAESSLRITRDL